MNGKYYDLVEKIANMLVYEKGKFSDSRIEIKKKYCKILFILHVQVKISNDIGEILKRVHGGVIKIKNVKLHTLQRI